MLKRTLVVLSLAILSQQAFADTSPWMMRVRAVNLDTANQSDAIPSLSVPEDAIHVSNKVIPEFDVSYFFNNRWAAELVLTYPQEHDVTVTESAVGSFKAGSFKHLPPTLMLQYHFDGSDTFRPYIGAGLNYTLMSDVHLAVPDVTTLDLEHDSFGAAFQAGFDYRLNDRLFLNIDLKKIYIDSDVYASGSKVSHVDVDPLAFAIGLGWFF